MTRRRRYTEAAGYAYRHALLDGSTRGRIAGVPLYVIERGLAEQLDLTSDEVTGIPADVVTEVSRVTADTFR